MSSYKRLYRSRNERMVAGVAGGIADYFNIDPTIIRLLFVIATLFGGPGLIAYIVLAIVVPEEPGLVPPPPVSEPVVEPPQDNVL
jgi:phage shock protein C